MGHPPLPTIITESLVALLVWHIDTSVKKITRTARMFTDLAEELILLSNIYNEINVRRILSSAKIETYHTSATQCILLQLSASIFLHRTCAVT